MGVKWWPLLIQASSCLEFMTPVAGICHSLLSCCSSHVRKIGRLSMMLSVAVFGAMSAKWHSSAFLHTKVHSENAYEVHEPYDRECCAVSDCSALRQQPAGGAHWRPGLIWAGSRSPLNGVMGQAQPLSQVDRSYVCSADPFRTPLSLITDSAKLWQSNWHF